MIVALVSILFRRPLFSLFARELVPTVERALETRHSVFYLTTWQGPFNFDEVRIGPFVVSRSNHERPSTDMLRQARPEPAEGLSTNEFSLANETLKRPCNMALSGRQRCSRYNKSCSAADPFSRLLPSSDQNHGLDLELCIAGSELYSDWARC